LQQKYHVTLKAENFQVIWAQVMNNESRNWGIKGIIPQNMSYISHPSYMTATMTLYQMLTFTNLGIFVPPNQTFSNTPAERGMYY